MTPSTLPPKDPRRANREFGLVMAAFLLIVGLSPLRHGMPMRSWALIGAAVFGILALVAPMLLRLPNRIWLWLGDWMGRIVSPISMAVVFYLVLTPMAWLTRRTRKLSMPLGFDRAADSYWIPRDPPGPDPKDMKNQF